MKIKLLAIMAKLLGIQFHVGGLPYGVAYQFRAGSLSQSPHGVFQAAQSCDSRATKVVSSESV